MPEKILFLLISMPQLTVRLSPNLNRYAAARPQKRLKQFFKERSYMRARSSIYKCRYKAR